MKALVLLLVLMAGAATSNAWAADERELDAQTEEDLQSLRNGLLESFNKGDMDALLELVTPDVVVTWQNAEVCRGPDGIREYYNRIVTGPNRAVSAASAKPEISGRHIHDDWGISWGLMNDQFTLTDGTELDMHSRFTAIVRKQAGGWRIAAFHVSVNAFDNAILHLAIHKTMITTAAISGAVALVVGVLVGRATKRAASNEARA